MSGKNFLYGHSNRSIVCYKYDNQCPGKNGQGRIFSTVILTGAFSITSMITSVQFRIVREEILYGHSNRGIAYYKNECVEVRIVREKFSLRHSKRVHFLLCMITSVQVRILREEFPYGHSNTGIVNYKNDNWNHLQTTIKILFRL